MGRFEYSLGFTSRVADSKYDHIDFKPPESVANAATKGLEYRQKASPSNRGGLTPSEASKQGIGSGVQRAVNLKNRSNISPKVIRQMAAFFSRHEKNKSIGSENKGTPWNDKGYVSWLLWGGDAGRSWADKIIKQMDAADEKASKSASSVVLTPEKMKLLHQKGKVDVGDSTVIYKKAELEDACWEGYEAIGMKEKDGKRVPNCVPKKKASLEVIALRVAAKVTLTQKGREKFPRE